jgi:uncharacterized protein YjbI with pentapeptide repeats
MLNRVEPINDITVRSMGVGKRLLKTNYFKLTFKDLLTILTAVTVPIAIGIYTVVTTDQQTKAAKLVANEQQRFADERRQFDFKQAAESQQQHLYNNFIDDIYQLHRDGELNDSQNPWAFANARFRALHRQLDGLRKAYVLQFLKEKQLIGRNPCQTGCEQRQLDDIIRLNELNFDGLKLLSENGKLNRLNFKCVEFDHVSLVNATITNVDLSGAIFHSSQLNGVNFTGSSLACATFNGTLLNGTNFGDSNLEGATFINVDRSTVILTAEQLRQSTFLNTIMSNGTILNKTSTTSTAGKSSVPVETTSTYGESPLPMQTTLTGGGSSLPVRTTSTNGKSSLPMETTSAYGKSPLPMQTTLTDGESSLPVRTTSTYSKSSLPMEASTIPEG